MSSLTLSSQSTEHAADEARWWQRGVIYHVYPRSFQDSNSDGIGDLEGIRRRLPYLNWLGVDAIWISPFYRSPMADFGYDVADYCDVDPVFGTLDDFDRLASSVHKAGLKLILDFVPNHTSDRHAWFQDSRSAKAAEKRDWYIWRDPHPDGGPPNNWMSHFGGSAWEFDEASGQYYYHAFLKEQPDLNWRNPDVRAAMYDVLRFWLDRGADGFRVDVIYHLMKDESLRDNPPNASFSEGQPDIERLEQVYSMDHPDVQGVVAEMRAVVDEYEDRVLIGEIYLPVERLVAYYGRDLNGAHLPFNFQLIEAAWDAQHIRSIINEYERALPDGGWPNWVLGNHDRKRIASRVGQAQGRVAAMLLLTLRGTPTMFYGDEIGMEQVEIPLEAARDPWEIREPGLGVGRDPARTPMQWDGLPSAGFTTGTPWLPLETMWRDRNVEAESTDPNSILMLARELIGLRRAHAALSIGSYRDVPGPPSILAYERVHGSDRLLVALNFSQEPTQLKLDGFAGRILLSCRRDLDNKSIHGSLMLAGCDGIVVDVHPLP